MIRAVANELQAGSMMHTLFIIIPVVILVLSITRAYLEWRDDLLENRNHWRNMYIDEVNYALSILNDYHEDIWGERWSHMCSVFAAVSALEECREIASIQEPANLWDNWGVD